MTHTFRVESTCPQTAARAGVLATRHGTIDTPAFMPVGSQGTVKTLTPEEVSGLGFRMVLANTYHLYLRPGVPVVQAAGGLHRFMGWQGSILTDSGGYQVFSLASLSRISEEGVKFKSHLDGSGHFFSPELAMAHQEALGADIVMALDECPSTAAPLEAVREATERTHRWAERCLKAHKRQDQALYGIVQGGIFAPLRRQSAQIMASLGFPGYGIGGLSLGESKEMMLAALEESVPYLPMDKPRYLMGVGSPEDLVQGIARGVDLFDSALPTRVARNGGLFTAEGRRNIRNASFKEQQGPVDPGCACYTCRSFSASYLHHLFKAEELLAYRLGTIHNLFFVARLMERARQAIREGTFAGFREEMLGRYRPASEEVRLEQKKRWLSARPRGPD